MFIIDSHNHLCKNAGKLYNFSDTPADMIGELRSGGISGTIFCPVDGTMCKSVDDLTAGNTEALELFDAYSDYLYPGVGLHPDFFEQSCYWLDKFCERNLVWTGENLSYHTNILFDDERWMKLFRICNERNLIVQLHNAPEVVKLAKALPELTIIGSHLNPDVIPQLVDLKNVYLDISGMHGGLCRNSLIRAREMFGAERLLFGTDYPGYDFLPFIERVKRDFSVAEQEMVFSGNVLKLLKEHGAREAFGRML